MTNMSNLVAGAEVFILWGEDSAEGDFFVDAYVDREAAELAAKHLNATRPASMTVTTCYWKVKTYQLK